MVHIMAKMYKISHGMRRGGVVVINQQMRGTKVCIKVIKWIIGGGSKIGKAITEQAQTDQQICIRNNFGIVAHRFFYIHTPGRSWKEFTRSLEEFVGKS